MEKSTDRMDARAAIENPRSYFMARASEIYESMEFYPLITWKHDEVQARTYSSMIPESPGLDPNPPDGVHPTLSVESLFGFGSHPGDFGVISPLKIGCAGPKNENAPRGLKTLGNYENP